MKIAVIGIGNVGSVLGRRWAQNGHEVIFGVQNTSDESILALLKSIGPNVRTASVKDAFQFGDVILLAIPWKAAENILSSGIDLKGKILIDCINPIKEGLKGLDVGLESSAAEKVAGWAKGAFVVKAFNSVGSEVMANTVVASQAATLFICGDDLSAKKTVSKLGSDLGFEVCDCGPLTTARYLEPLGMLLTLLVVKESLGSRIAVKLLKDS